MRILPKELKIGSTVFRVAPLSRKLIVMDSFLFQKNVGRTFFNERRTKNCLVHVR